MLYADVGKFRDLLIQIGGARRYYLQKSQQQGNVNDRYLAISRTEAFFDALAAGELTLARDIARASITRWKPDWEYQDDFCYYHFLHQLLLDPAAEPDSPLADILAEFEQSLEGGSSVRLPVCQALLARDLDGFVAALTAFLEAKQAQDEERRPNVVDSSYLF
jgi:hypothetical protein